jgi:hypothetical protein
VQLFRLPEPEASERIKISRTRDLVPWVFHI